MGDYIHYSFKAISKWENGDSLPDIDVMSDIATKFNLTIDELISDKDVVVLSNKVKNRIFITITASLLPILLGTITFFVLLFSKVPLAAVCFPGAGAVSGVVMLTLSAVWFRKRIIFIASAAIVANIVMTLMIIFNFTYWWLLIIIGLVTILILGMFFFIEMPTKRKRIKYID